MLRSLAYAARDSERHIVDSHEYHFATEWPVIRDSDGHHLSSVLRARTTYQACCYDPKAPLDGFSAAVQQSKTKAVLSSQVLQNRDVRQNQVCERSEGAAFVRYSLDSRVPTPQPQSTHIVFWASGVAE